LRSLLLAIALVISASANAQQYTVTATADPVTEGNSGSRQAVVRLAINPAVPAGEQVRIRVATRDGVESAPIGAARSGRDYAPLTTTVTFTGGGASEATVNVSLLPDTTRESTEQVGLALTVLEAAGGAALQPALLNLQILNDDPLPPGWGFGVSGSTTVEFDPSAVGSTFVQRPGIYGGTLAGAMRSGGVFSAVVQGGDALALIDIDALTLLPSERGAVGPVAPGERIAALAARGEELFALIESESEGRVVAIGPTGAVGAPVFALPAFGGARTLMMHPITGEFLIVEPGALTRVPADGTGPLTPQPLAGGPVDLTGVGAFNAATGRLHPVLPADGADVVRLGLLSQFSASFVSQAAVELPVSTVEALGFVPPVVTPSAYLAFGGDVAVDEPSAPTAPLLLNIISDPAAASPLDVALSAVAGTALLGRDFLAPSPESVTIAAGMRVATASYPILRNGLPTAPLTFEAVLTPPAGAVAAFPRALVTIRDIDAEPRFQFDAPEAAGLWRIRPIDGPMNAVATIAASPGAPLTPTVLAVSADDGSPLYDFAIESPAADLTGAGWVRLEWTQAAILAGGQDEVLPIVEVSLTGGVSWQPVFSQPTDDPAGVGAPSAPRSFSLDLTPELAGQPNASVRFRFRNAAITAFYLDEARLMANRADSGSALGYVPNTVLREGGDPIAAIVPLRFPLPSSRATEWVIEPVGGSAVVGRDFNWPTSGFLVPAGTTEFSVPFELLGNDQTVGLRTIELSVSCTTTGLATRAVIGLQEDDVPGAPRLALLGPDGGFALTTAGAPAILASDPGTWPQRRLLGAEFGAEPRWQAHTVETGPIPRLIGFRLDDRRVIRTRLLPTGVVGNGLLGFAWDPTTNGWLILRAGTGGPELVALDAASLEAGAVRVLGESDPLAGLEAGIDGSVYTVRTSATEATLLRFPAATLTPDLEVALGVPAGAPTDLELNAAEDRLRVAIGFAESIQGTVSSALVEVVLPDGVAAPAMTLGNSLTPVAGILDEDSITPPPAPAGWQLR